MKITAAVLVLAAFAISFAIFPLLPETMPVHWDLHGKANGFQSKMFGAFTMPFVVLGLALLFALLPRISPRGFEIDADSRAFRAITISILVFTIAIHTVVLLSAAGVRVAMARVIPILLGAMFASLGNYLGKIKRNFFIGIRTPWTLADDDVWFRTHRFSGKLFVAAGILSMIGGLAFGDRAFAFVIGAVMVTALVSIVYSYVIYQDLQRQKSAGS